MFQEVTSCNSGLTFARISFQKSGEESGTRPPCQRSGGTSKKWGGRRLPASPPHYTPGGRRTQSDTRSTIAPIARTWSTVKIQHTGSVHDDAIGWALPLALKLSNARFLSPSTAVVSLRILMKLRHARVTWSNAAFKHVAWQFASFRETSSTLLSLYLRTLLTRL